jgi:hypothetical protein
MFNGGGMRDSSLDFAHGRVGAQPDLGRANLDLTRVPEAADGFRIVREWIRFVCDNPQCSSNPPAR